MSTPNMNLLPVGTSSFSALRDFNQIYVDKTGFIADLAGKRGKFFLARPRRFGKSLLISTFESLFRNGKKHFEGLAICDYWKDKFYNVVRLDFSEIRNVENSESFEKDLTSLLVRKFSAVGFVAKSGSDYRSLCGDLSYWLDQLPDNSLVILVDEYDAPLTDTLDNRDLFLDVRRLLSRFYSLLKANDAAVRFLFITGITKFQKTSIFSELNNLQDISLDEEYATLLGYTREEMERYFLPYMQESALKLNMSLPDLREKLTEYYDGYSFDRFGKTHVFTPWSVLNFLSRPAQGFVNYWYESGGKPQMLLKYIQSHALRDPRQFNRLQALSESDLTGSSDLDVINDVALLTQAGYLTIKREDDGTIFVGYPNREVELSMANLYIGQLLRNKTLPAIGAGGIGKALSVGNASRVIELFNHFFAAIPYEDYRNANEGFVRAIMYVALRSERTNAMAEVHNAHGRSDLEVRIGGYHWVIEVKFARKGESEALLLSAGLKQVKERRYGEPSEGCKLSRLVAVFSEEKRQITLWEML